MKKAPRLERTSYFNEPLILIESSIEVVSLSRFKNRQKPLSVTKNSVGLRTDAAVIMGAAVVAQVARSGRLRTDAVICN